MLKYFNKRIRSSALKVYHGNIACLVCSHVQADPAQAGFVSSRDGTWAAFCSEDCPDIKSEDRLSSEHLAHLICGDEDHFRVFAMPGNAQAKSNGRNWRYKPDVSGRYEPNEGDFFIASQEESGGIVDDMPVNIAKTISGAVVTVTLDSTLKIIPFYEGAVPKNFLNFLDGTESIESVKFSDLKQIARKMSVDFGGRNFLIDSMDEAMIFD